MRRKEAGFIAAQAAIFVGVIALVSLPLQFSNNTQVSTSSTVNEGPLVFASGLAPDGLQLKMVLNATSMRYDGAITGNVTVVNTSNQNVSIPQLVQNQNITKWNSDDYFCAGNPSYSLLGFALFQGHFTAANVSAAGSPLRLAPPMVGSCGGIEIALSAVTFLPNGDHAGAGQPEQFFQPASVELNATTTFCNGVGNGNGGFSCTWAYPGLVGFWNDNVPSQGNLFGFTSTAFVHFPSGEYTIVAADDWNQYVYATFVVQPADTSLTSSATSYAAACGVGTQVITLNGTEYCAIDAENDTVIGSPGYSYFRNDSVTFEGVKFQTICPSTAASSGRGF